MKLKQKHPMINQARQLEYSVWCTRKPIYSRSTNRYLAPKNLKCTCFRSSTSRLGLFTKLQKIFSAVDCICQVSFRWERYVHYNTIRIFDITFREKRCFQIYFCSIYLKGLSMIIFWRHYKKAWNWILKADAMFDYHVEIALHPNGSV